MKKPNLENLAKLQIVGGALRAKCSVYSRASYINANSTLIINVFYFSFKTEVLSLVRIVDSNK